MSLPLNDFQKWKNTKMRRKCKSAWNVQDIWNFYSVYQAKQSCELRSISEFSFFALFSMLLQMKKYNFQLKKSEQMKAKSECCEKHMFMNLSCINKLSNLILKVFFLAKWFSLRLFFRASESAYVSENFSTSQVTWTSGRKKSLFWGMLTFPKSINCQHILPTANPNKNKRLEMD